MSSTASNVNATRGRRGARRLAMQALYQWLLAGGREAPIVADFLAESGADAIDREYFRELTMACIGEREALDVLLASCLDRPPAELDPVEHAILLIGAAELRDRNELAVSIVTNEAVELAKAFGAEGSHRYANGVLDRLAATLRPLEKAGSADSGG
ncbi:MAG: transcription antitermination factor NusB [Gammaproteobacteria bacterium]